MILQENRHNIQKKSKLAGIFVDEAVNKIETDVGSFSGKTLSNNG
jgi:hypothetical protein